MTGTAEAARDFDPSSDPHRENPFAFFSWARESAPITYVPALGAWMVSRYEDVTRVLTDNDLFSSRNALTDIERDNPPEVARILAGTLPIARTIVQIDPPQHARQRALWRRALRGTRISGLKPGMYQLADELIDAFADDGQADLVEQFAQPFILRSICDLIGIPEGEHDDAAIADQSFLILLIPNADAESKRAAAQQYVDFDGYLLNLLEERRRQPAGDLLTELAALVDDPDEPFDDANALMFVRSVLAGGTHTPAYTISATLLNTLRERTHWERMLAEPAAITAVIEETLRRDAPHRGLMRITTRDTEIRGVPLPAGSAIFPMLGSANRDGDHFPQPDTFQPARDAVRTHVAFGHGPHDCVGEHLARTQARAAIEVLTKRLPDMHLAPDYVPAHMADWFFWGLAHLDVTFTR